MPAPIRDPLHQFAADAFAAFGLLTRLPVPFTLPRPAGVWVWPFVGLVVGSIALGVGALALWLGVSVGVAAVLVMALQATLTGGLHEDGLADCADGFWGGHTIARRQEIMKDSRIGSYGALALMLALLARWSALAALMTAEAWGLALAAMILSRAAMGLVMAGLPNARKGGLSAQHGQPPMRAALAGLGLALVLGLVLAGGGALTLGLIAGLAAGGLALVARAKIGGQTGDVLGATQVLAEIAALAAATSLVA